MPYERQGRSLSRVQLNAPQLEEQVKSILNARGGYVQCDEDSAIKLQTDIVIPDPKKPATIVSVTSSDPDKPGHSNENKFQLKIGELYLIKTYDPNIRVILVMGGTELSWLSYVTKAFAYFFDDVAYVWDKDFKQKLVNALACPLRNESFWKAEQKRREKIIKATSIDEVPNSKLRQKFYENVIKKYLGVVSPDQIEHPVLRKMAFAAHQAYMLTLGKSGLFWKHLSDKNYDAIWQERNYFNPNEAIVELIIEKGKFYHVGKTGRDVEVHNLLHDFGIIRTRVGEDFVLYSRKHDCPIYIQCKASGGGKNHHGKNIMNRAKEQIGRSVLYRSESTEGTIISKEQDFLWIGILDGNWRLPEDAPSKYYNMLKIAGYDKMIGADSLVDDALVPLTSNKLEAYLEEIDCYKADEIPEHKRKQIEQRFKVVTEIE